MSRRVLITGAGGFVGSHLAQGFAAMGDSVIGVDQAFDAKTSRRLAGVELIERDMLAAGDDLPAADLVIHGAAITTPPEAGEDQLLGANVAMLQAGLRHAVACGAGDFVFISSSGVFSPEDGDGIHLESTVPTATLPYARAKRAGEDALSEAGKLRAIAIRLGPIYGPHEEPRQTRTIVSPVQRWLGMALRGEPIIVEMPEERRDWTYAPDLAGALDALLRREPTERGVFHLTSGQIFANGEVARMIAELVPGADVRASATSRTLRLPMSSDRLDLDALYGWTPIQQGLVQILQEEGRA
jgi:nucleoside-diphosphate-sugar epimerase